MTHPKPQVSPWDPVRLDVQRLTQIPKFDLSQWITLEGSGCYVSDNSICEVKEGGTKHDDVKMGLRCIPFCFCLFCMCTLAT